ncbi:MAG: GH3 auxin-responsive promoter family protein, partial [Planctomycetes bacterium]|nr:GH3 auxin-responsive promoter family protein [Planctomycetota bacterium]
RLLHGETKALLPDDQPVLMFSMTSGTTGEPKRIPVTGEALAQYRRGWNVFGIKLLVDHPNGWLRKILQVAGNAAESVSPTGIPCGAISGLLAAGQKRIVRRMYVAGSEVAAIEDTAARYYTLMRLGMPQDVGWISTANPSTIINLLGTAQRHVESLLRDLRDGTLTPPGPVPQKIRARLRLQKHGQLVRRIEEGMARDGQLLVRHFWDLAFCLNWTGGTLGLYLPALRELIGRTPIRDIGLLASEGRFSVPLEDETPAGVADILSAFLEFIPADQIDAASPTLLRSHELEVGGEYFLVLTNFAGLWRYNINDRIRVTAMMGESPVFAFLSKGAHTANITGEKLTEHQVVQAMQLAAGRLGLPIRRFLAQGHFDWPPFYSLRVEADEGTLSENAAGELARVVDEQLCRLNIEYAAKRRTGRLGPIRLVGDGAGTCTSTSTKTFDERERQILRQRRGREEQYKHQYLLTEVITSAGAGESNDR